MKFVHAADFHFGATPESGTTWAKERAEAVSHALPSVVELCNKEGADLLLIPGDLFNKPPLRKELKEVAYIFSKLEKTEVVITAGNHDYLSEGCAFINYDLGDHVHLISSPEMDSIYFEDINTEVHGFSYYKKEIREGRYDNISAPHDDRLHVLLAHGGDPLHVPIKFSNLSISGFDYIALGHIHQPRVFKDVHMAYSGSPEPLDHTDIGSRGCFVGEVTKDSFSMMWYPIAKTKYRKLDIVSDNTLTQSALEDCISENLKENPDDLLVVNLTGVRDPEFTIDTGALFNLGRVACVNDETHEEYDLEKIMYNHNGDLIGYYINTLDTQDKTPVMEKALYYGLKELLGKEDLS